MSEEVHDDNNNTGTETYIRERESVAPWLTGGGGGDDGDDGGLQETNT